MSKPGEEVVEAFYEYATMSIDEKGIYPLPMVSIDKEGKMEMSAMAIDGFQALGTFLKKIAKREVEAIMIGLDRTTKPGQGTEFADVLTCVMWERQQDWTEPGEWRKWLKAGVINYQHEPRIVRPIDWGNKYWNEQMAAECDNIRLRRNSTGQEL